MKKLFALALALLTLCGCGTEPAVPTTGESTPSTEEDALNHDALEILEFEYEDVYAAAPMGDDLLLFSGTARDTTLIKLNGRNHKQIASVSTNAHITPGDPAVQISEEGVCYATEEEHIFLDGNLTEIERVSLPDALGQGVVAADQQTIYYSTGSEIRVYSRETGLDRLLREKTHSALLIDELHLNDTILVCHVRDYSTVSPTLFYSAATGKLLNTYHGSFDLASVGDLWLAHLVDGQQDRLVFGSDSAASQSLTVGDGSHDPFLLSNGVLIQTDLEETVTIEFVNLSDNTSAAVTLEGAPLVTNAWSGDNILWFSLNDGRLCRWNLEDTVMQAAVSCIAPYYSRENPDTEGMAALEPTIREFEDYYGVEIHIAEDAVALQSDGMALYGTYQADILAVGLEELRLALTGFTPEFMANAGKASGDGKVHISLVRSVSSSGCIQFWDADGIAHIVLAVDHDLQQNFYHGLGHIIDARVMSECSAFDNWKNLNPKGFSYSYDHAVEGDPSEFPGAFTDSLGMTDPVEDRACIFARAILTDMDSVFEGETMQRKLSTLCSGIRKAFGLTDSEDTFPWEQYLAE